MRPGSEIHSALDMIEEECARLGDDSPESRKNLTIARDVLRWVVGESGIDLASGDNPWLAAYLLDDPDELDDSDPANN